MLFDLVTSDNELILFDSEKNAFYDKNNNRLNKNTDNYRRCAPGNWDKTKSGKINVAILLGTKCNMDCFYCIAKKIIKRTIVPDFTPKRVSHFIGLIPYISTEIETITLYGGEPLVYWKTLLKLLPALRQRFPVVDITMPTNGTLLTAEKIKFLKKYKVSVALSCHNIEQVKKILNNEEVVNALKEKPTLELCVKTMLSKETNSVYESENEFEQRGIPVYRYVHQIVHPGPCTQCKINDFYITEKTKKEYQKTLTVRFLKKEKLVPEYLNDIETIYREGKGIDCIDILHNCSAVRGRTLPIDCYGRIYQCYTNPEIVTGHLKEFQKFPNKKFNNLYTTYIERDACFVCPYVTTCGGVCSLIKNEHTNIFKKACEIKKIRAEAQFRIIIERVLNKKIKIIRNHYTKQTINKFDDI